MLVKDLMSRFAISVEMDDTLAEVKKIFDSVSFHHLLVVEKGKLFGVLSDRDLLKALGPTIGTLAETEKDLATLQKKVHHVMTRKPVSLPADADIYTAIALFNENKISCIPIVEKDKPVGILSWRDLIRFLGSLKRD
ncbi:CBS domain-containing protein [Sulfuriflexus sp.]|uniref:CBS domain-containing protein n=1 Tax=Sulfuriflexus sp. TaxID=2015443 RepID=UPI0028CE1B68|nr:CBS domain-containing protein [Sulfuriflexus sp.]MDT8405263.1 CBS domain-containing protein [Sulfuriflexus sp.]